MPYQKTDNKVYLGYHVIIQPHSYQNHEGWKNEGVAWKAPAISDSPVYRLYNPNTGDHHYTPFEGERDSLVAAGWTYEGIGWYSYEKKTQTLFRLYNPNAATGSHHYTTDAGERDFLIANGWKDEGIGWYGM